MGTFWEKTLNCQINDKTKKENLSDQPTARRFESTNQLRSPCMGLKVTDDLIVVFFHARNVSYSWFVYVYYSVHMNWIMNSYVGSFNVLN